MTKPKTPTNADMPAPPVKSVPDAVQPSVRKRKRRIVRQSDRQMSRAELEIYVSRHNETALREAFPKTAKALKSVKGRTQYRNAKSWLSPELKDFAQFLLEVGPCPDDTYSVERIINSRRIYERGNIKWASPQEQARNRETNLNITWHGETYTLKEWADLTQINYKTLYSRHVKGEEGDRLFRGSTLPAYAVASTRPARRTKSEKAQKVMKTQSITHELQTTPEIQTAVPASARPTPTVPHSMNETNIPKIPHVTDDFQTAPRVQNAATIFDSQGGITNVPHNQSVASENQTIQYRGISPIEHPINEGRNDSAVSDASNDLENDHQARPRRIIPLIRPLATIHVEAPPDTRRDVGPHIPLVAAGLQLPAVPDMGSDGWPVGCAATRWEGHYRAYRADARKAGVAKNDALTRAAFFAWIIGCNLNVSQQAVLRNFPHVFFREQAAANGEDLAELDNLAINDPDVLSFFKLSAFRQCAMRQYASEPRGQCDAKVQFAKLRDLQHRRPCYDSFDAAKILLKGGTPDEDDYDQVPRQQR